MRGLAEAAAKYRWELLLFIGLPMLSDAAAFEVLSFPLRIVLLIARTTGVLIPNLAPVTLGIFSLHVHAFLLGILYYLHVRRSGRRTLSLVWPYAFAATAIGAVAAWAPDLDSPWEWLAPGAEALAGGVVLVWFATRASRFSLGHAFLLIGLSTALHGYGTVAIYLSVPWTEGNPTYWLVAIYLSVPWTEGNPTYWLVAILAIAQGLLAVRVLAQFDTDRTLSRNAIIALFALDGTMLVVLEIVRGTDPAAQAALSAVVMLGSWAAWYGVVTLLTYVARSRQPFDPGPYDAEGPAPWGPLRES